MPKMNNMTRCPHCRAVCQTVKTVQVTEMYREITFACRNDACGHIFVASIQPVRTLEPSKTPNPEVHITRRAVSG
ncbi:MAG: ogr/Delta-like zinc finger family protein [Alphaproteobacteria bacterium]|nr:ogr/Delta-like zinc finger family protein [Alphaproteobacteria bacterium]